MTIETSLAFDAATALTVTAPGDLLRIQFATQALRLCTRGDIVWNGELYIGKDFRVTGASMDGARASVEATIVIPDVERLVWALIDNDGIADRAVELRRFYGNSAPALYDVMPVLIGAADSAAVDINTGEVSIVVYHQAGKNSKTPRRFITAEEGFSNITPAGTILSFNGQQFRLDHG